MDITRNDICYKIVQARPRLLDILVLDARTAEKLQQIKVLTTSLEDGTDHPSMTPMQKVDQLLDHIIRGPVWKFLYFCKAMHEEGRLDVLEALNVDMDYIENQLDFNSTEAEGNDPSESSRKGHQGPHKKHFYKRGESGVKIPISADLLPGLLSHCKVSERILMKTPLFGFHDDIIVDLTQLHINTDVNVEGRPIEWKELFNCLFQRHEPNTLLLESDPGTGKTTCLEDYAYKHCKEFAECEEKGPSSPCPGHNWKLILYIPARSVIGTQEAAIRDALHCAGKDKDQLMRMIEDDGEGVLIINDGLEELRRMEEMESIRQYTIAQQKGGRPKVLNSARTGHCPIGKKFFDRTLNLGGFTLSQGLRYVELHFRQSTSSKQTEKSLILMYIKQQTRELSWVLTNPLYVQIFAELAVTGEVSLEDIRKLTRVKLFKVLEAIIMKRELEKVDRRDTADRHSAQFYRLCLECLLKDERRIQDELLELSPYTAFLHKEKRINESFFTFSHEILLEFFSVRGLIEYIKSNPANTNALLLCICANTKFQNTIELLFDWISKYEPQLHQHLVFITKAWLIMQTGGRRCKKNHLTERLLRIPSMIKQRLTPYMVYKGLREEQTTMTREICGQIQAAFNENAELLRTSGWMLNAYTENVKPNPNIAFISSCLRQCTAEKQEEICQQTMHRLLPCERNNDGIRESIIPVSGVRWATVQTHKDISDVTVTKVSVWHPSDIPHIVPYIPSTKRHDLVIDLSTPVSLWGAEPDRVLTLDLWASSLSQVLTQRVGNICIVNHPESSLDGLLTALQQVKVPTRSLTGGVHIIAGQVSERVLEEFCEWTRTYGVKLSDVTVSLAEDRDEEYTTHLYHRISDHVHSPRFLNPDNQLLNYAGLESTYETDGKPWELELLEEKYQAAYEEACKRGTETVYQTRVMVVGHYGAGKTNLVRCVLEKDFMKEHKTTIGIDADPLEAKVDITKTENWKLYKEETFTSRVAKHVVAEVQKENHLITEALQDMSSFISQSWPQQEEGGQDQYKRPESYLHDTVDIVSLSDSYSVCDPMDTGEQLEEEENEAKDGAGSFQRTKKQGVPTAILEGIRREEEKTRKEEYLHERKPRNLFFWDFAGQGVFYTTHQLFLTARSLYIIVMNLKQKMTASIPTSRTKLAGESIPDDSCPQTVQEYLEYWLSSIHTQVESSGKPGIQDRRSGPQVIIALTHKDECSEKEVKEYTDSIYNFLEEKGYGFLVEQVTAISNLERDPNDVNQLRGTLEKLAGDSKYVVPLPWYKLMECIRRDGRKQLTLSEVYMIVKEADLSELDDINLEAALSFFHETGDIVYFAEGTLADFIVTDTQWLIDQFKKVITISEAHKESSTYSENEKHWTDLDEHGILHQKLLGSVWHENIRVNLLDMMLKFALLMPAPDFYNKYKTNDEDILYLVPCLLPSGKHLAKPQTDKVVRLCPNTGFLPVGLVSRLLSSLSNSIEPKWDVCGEVYHDSARFRISQMEVAICLRHQTDGNLNSLKVIEVTASTTGGTEERKLRETLATIAESLQDLPGRNDFGVWLFCASCQQWNFICDLNDLDDRQVCNRSICNKHSIMVKQSEHALWFCERREEQMDADLNKHPGDSKAAQEYSHISKLEGVADLLADRKQNLTIVLLLSFINDINEEQLVQMGFPVDHWKAAVLIVSEIRGSPRWRVKGFCRAFPLGIQNLIRQIDRLNKVTFTRCFTEEYGVLKDPRTDVVLTVPTGAVPPGKTVDVCVTINTDLDTYKEVVKNDNSILGPMVECEMDRRMTFHKPVTLAIPLCITPKDTSKISVLYSDGDTFKEISTDKSMFYKFKGNILEIETYHFTEFVVHGEIVDIRNVLLTLGARLQHGPKSSKLTLMPVAHVNCLILKEFEEYRTQTSHRNFKEIDRELISLPEGEEPLQFPEIITEVWVKEESPWRVLDDANKDAELCSLEKRKRGRDILYIKEWASRPLPKFLLESAGVVEQAECRMNITFKYKEDGIEPVVHPISVVYPAITDQKKPRAGMAGVAADRTTSGGRLGLPAATGHGLDDPQGGDFEWMRKEFDRIRCSLDSQSCRPVVIALLDSGMDTAHPRLTGIVQGSQDFIMGPPDAAGNPTTDAAEDMDLTRDSLGHGTFCAGILKQHAGQHVKILNLKVIKQENTVNPTDVLQALTTIQREQNIPVDIIHMAFGVPQNAEVDKMLAILGEEKVLIAAAGNDGQQRPDTILSPASHGSVIAVGACDETGGRAGISAVGKKLDCLFPGQDIQSYWSRYAMLRDANGVVIDRSRYDNTEGGLEVELHTTNSGTSFAAPHCAALVALILARVEAMFPRNGAHWRGVLTKSANMRELLKRFCTAPTAERGYGVPDLQEMTDEMIRHHLRVNLKATGDQLC